MYKILFVDSVTTGMSPEKCAIYRLGGIFTVNGVEKLRFELRMRPFDTARIADQSLWICNETRSSLIYYPSQEEGFKDFIKLLDRQVNLHNSKDKIFIGGFNTDRFEYPFLREWFRRNGNERFRDYFYVQTIDMMSITNLKVLTKRTSLPDFHLETAARHIGITAAGTDKYDCIQNSKTCLDMFRKISFEWGIDNVQDDSITAVCYKNF